MPLSQTKTGHGSNTLIWIVLIAVFVGLGGFGLSLRSIHSNVADIVDDARSVHGGDAVAALIARITSDEATFREKNRAIRALGQIGDKRALPALERLETGEPQEKPYDPDGSIVQYSVRKAIEQIRSDFSLTRWMYREFRGDTASR